MNKSRYNALFAVSRKMNKYDFDSQTYSIKNKLLIFSTILIAMSFVSPDEKGAYEINMGIIKGDLSSPRLLFGFLGLVVFYHLFWFVCHIRRQVVNSYGNINGQFMQELTNNHAKASFMELVKKSNERFGSCPRFEYQQHVNNLKKKATANISLQALRNYPETKDLILNSAEFKAFEQHDLIKLDYDYLPKSEDYTFFNIHKDLCWITRIDEMFVTTLPIIYSVASIVVIIIHVIKEL